MISPSACWGTGQYKVEMDISESCLINEEFYTDSKDGKRKWIKERWQPEWKLMKKRQRRGGSGTLADIIFPQFTGDSWITTIAEPAVTMLMSEEGKLINAASTKFQTKIGASAGQQKTPAGNGGQKR